MKIIKIEENRNILKKAYRDLPLFALREGIARRGSSEFAIIDNNEKEVDNAVLFTKGQVIDILATVPAELYKEMLENGVLVIKDKEVILNSPLKLKRDELITLGVNKEKVDNLPAKHVEKLLHDIKGGILFVQPNGELISKAEQDLIARQAIIEKALSVGIIDSKTLSLNNEMLEGAIAKRIKENVATDKDRAKVLEDLKDFMPEDTYKDAVELSTEALKDLLAKSKEFLKVRIKSLQEDIKATEFAKTRKLEKPKSYAEVVALEKEFVEYKKSLMLKAEDLKQESKEEEVDELPELSIQQAQVIVAKQKDAIEEAEEITKLQEEQKEEK